MQKKPISTQGAPAAIGPYSQGVCCGNMVFTSGQIPLDAATGELETGSIQKAAALALQNLKAVLNAAGAHLDDVVKTTVYLTDMADFAAVNEIYAQYFPQNAPARSCVAVAALPKGARVEIEAIAIVTEKE